MADEILMRLTGVDELKRAVADLPKVLRRRVLRNALAEGARVIQRQAKAAAPVLTLPTRRRRPGTVRANISVRTSKSARARGDVGVYVGVKPLRGARERKLGRRGADNPNDPYYWWWQEFGWTPAGRRSQRGSRIVRRATQARRGRIPGKRFLSGAAQSRGPEAINTFLRAVVPQVEKLNRKGALNVR